MDHRDQVSEAQSLQTGAKSVEPGAQAVESGTHCWENTGACSPEPYSEALDQSPSREYDDSKTVIWHTMVFKSVIYQS